MRVWVRMGAAVAAALMLAGCGGTAGTSGASGTPQAGTPTLPSTPASSTRVSSPAPASSASIAQTPADSAAPGSTAAQSAGPNSKPESAWGIGKDEGFTTDDLRVAFDCSISSLGTSSSAIQDLITEATAKTDFGPYSLTDFWECEHLAADGTTTKWFIAQSADVQDATTLNNILSETEAYSVQLLGTPFVAVTSSRDDAEHAAQVWEDYANKHYPVDSAPTGSEVTSDSQTTVAGTARWELTGSCPDAATLSAKLGQPVQSVTPQDGVACQYHAVDGDIGLDLYTANFLDDERAALNATHTTVKNLDSLGPNVQQSYGNGHLFNICSVSAPWTSDSGGVIAEVKDANIKPLDGEHLCPAAVALFTGGARPSA